MIRLCVDSEKPLTNGYVFYNAEDQGLDTFPAKKSSITLQGAYIQIGFDTEDMCANQVFGLAPNRAWKKCKLTAPSSIVKGALRILDEFDWGTRGIDWDKRWEMFFDPNTGWFCAGNPDFTGNVNANFIENAIAVLCENGEMKALWIKPVFHDQSL